MVSDSLDRDQECSILEEQTSPAYLMPALTNHLGQFPSFVVSPALIGPLGMCLVL